MNNFYFSPVMLPLAAVVGACSSLLKPGSQPYQTRNDSRVAQLAKDEIPDFLTHKAQLDTMLDDLGAKITERGMVITLGNDTFGTDLAPLNPTGMRMAQKLATVLLQQPQRTILIEGFTDDNGSVSYNQELSERRATAVRTALQELGLARERVTIRGYGEDYPIVANDTAKNRQLNRRVEIVLSDALGNLAAR